MTIVEIERLVVRYPTRRDPALAGLNLRIEAGERLLLAGQSGGGKSTLALCLNGLIPHSLPAEVSGRLVVDGLETRTARPEELARRVGVLFQDPSSQFTMLTVEDEVAFGLENLGLPRDEMDGRIASALVAVGMAAYRQRRLDRLSGGQQQRVALAGLLAMQPALLVLDEPTAHLDPLSACRLDGLLAELAEAGHTLVIIEHNLEPLLPVLSRVVALDGQGQMLTDGPPRGVLVDQAATLEATGVWLPGAVRLGRVLAHCQRPLADAPLTLADGASALVDSPAAAAWLRQLARPTALPAASVPAALQAIGLDWHYPTGPPVLDGVTARLPAGSFTAIVGENGAGKTTLALLLAGLLPAPPGRAIAFGRDLAGLAIAEIARLVGFVFQNPEHQFVTDTVFDEVAYGLRARRTPADQVVKRVDELLADFGLAPLAAANPFTLSRGQQRRLSVATMLAATPRALILDEPTFGQDARQAARLLTRLASMQRAGTTIGVVTHDLELVAEYATWTVALAGGRVVFEGPPGGLLADAALLERIGQVRPPLLELLALARARGADVPAYLRWADLAGVTGGARP